MRRAGLLGLVLVGLAFPAGLGLAVYVASGSSLVPPAVTSRRVPTGEIARPSVPPVTSTLETTDESTTEETATEETTTEETTLDKTTTDEDSGSGQGRGRGRGRGRSGDD